MADLKTAFWKKAAKSLPKPYQARYADYFAQAERFDRALTGFIGLFHKG